MTICAACDALSAGDIHQALVAYFLGKETFQMTEQMPVRRGGLSNSTKGERQPGIACDQICVGDRGDQLLSPRQVEFTQSVSQNKVVSFERRDHLLSITALKVGVMKCHLSTATLPARRLLATKQCQSREFAMGVFPATFIGIMPLLGAKPLTLLTTKGITVACSLLRGNYDGRLPLFASP